MRWSSLYEIGKVQFTPSEVLRQIFDAFDMETHMDAALFCF